MNTSIGTICLVLLVATTTMLANENGKAGRTSRLGQGCGDCHGITASAATTVTVLGVGGTVEMMPGSSREFTVVVAHNTLAVAGVDIAVHTVEDGETNVGTLTAGTNVRLKGSTGELTHAKPIQMSGGSASFTFTWKAPNEPATFYLQAIGNACNGDGSEDSHDQWAWMTPIQIVVSTTSHVAENSDRESAAPLIAPMPLKVGSYGTISGLRPGTNVIVIRDVQGRIVYQQQFEVATDADHFAFEGPALPSGMYSLTALAGERVTHTTLIID